MNNKKIIKKNKKLIKIGEEFKSVIEKYKKGKRIFQIVFYKEGNMFFLKEYGDDGNLHKKIVYNHDKTINYISTYNKDKLCKRIEYYNGEIKSILVFDKNGNLIKQTNIAKKVLRDLILFLSKRNITIDEIEHGFTIEETEFMEKVLENKAIGKNDDK